MDLKYANENHSTIINQKDGVVFLTFPKLVEAGVIHGFSTRIGGVSEGCFSSMNLSFTRGDDPKKVAQNFRRIGDAIGFDAKDLVLSSQVHETKIRPVTKKDRGDGIIRETVPGIDALVTDEPGVPLYTSYADCVPLLFFDPEHRVIGMAHSGWRGTVAKIGAKFVRYLEEHYGTKPENIVAAIGPSICRDCYEVGEEVAEEFCRVFDKEEIPLLMDKKENGKYQLDLWKANELILTGAGIRKENLDITDICTCCNSDVLFSHRASNGHRGNLGCFMYLDK
ncbi:MAG: peptidoglycan editing factor PgeF [Eubacterium sp.]|nr:peptidoglycan editing factor PgeF [Eubacterium sp.]MDD7209872.1 peptidoglycan editing factor PgeF [Lachnospiraceae bacterium]MDY5497936.1 peptidoglycan editing factor PgeF [Anaerobutyricum sp.]